ncbi:N-acetyltransferase [Pseudochrobactrum sp. sp1633]|uniref:GNAT family N-acetyltransferase n=1 Tax=Pseudochrobactrum sp. sp1633 TaxID=3036706 RepID=UPI0025A5FB88|nr:N-acetyltransferase [Pseudochrobactrum sp. sp1633]MDM8345949.1 N-acetyltransferase [Pseudochrobactrum sp. sp1633]HWD12188.1 N-acetyltransferase [Pseudochrobactrum sp.]
MSQSPVKQLHIRPAKEQDRSLIDGVIAAAFNGNDEVALVRKLVADGDVVLELVAEANGHVTGHILFSRVWIEHADGRTPAVALAPLAVLPEMQRAGVGRALIAEAHEQLAKAGEGLSIVLGDPAYYGRFGYRLELASGFESNYPAHYLQARYLSENHRDLPHQGRLIYASAFGEN